MRKIKVAFVFGTRPEAIKLAPVIRLFRQQENIDVNVCFTGQHREMVTRILPLFDITPDVDLQLMTDNQSLAGFMGKALDSVGSYLEQIKPNCVFVQGDTSTVLAGALVAFYNQILIFHVEAGLRTWNKFSPYPEEMNRVLVSKLADYHFPPTLKAGSNLLKEGISKSNYQICGNTGIDALLYIKSQLDQKRISSSLSNELRSAIDSRKRIILITAHRRENIDKGIKNICTAVNELSRRYEDCLFVWPVHLNPNVREDIYNLLQGNEKVILSEPLNYLEFVDIMRHSYLILTDSGGIQEEAPSLGKPLVVLRDTTERQEGIDAGCAVLVGTNIKGIIENVCELLDSQEAYVKMSKSKNPFGDGAASERILEYFKNIMKLNIEVDEE